MMADDLDIRSLLADAIPDFGPGPGAAALIHRAKVRRGRKVAAAALLALVALTHEPALPSFDDTHRVADQSDIIGDGLTVVEDPTELSEAAVGPVARPVRNDAWATARRDGDSRDAASIIEDARRGGTSADDGEKDLWPGPERPSDDLRAIEPVPAYAAWFSNLVTETATCDPCSQAGESAGETLDREPIGDRNS